MNLHYIHFRKKDFESKNVSGKRYEPSMKKISKQSKNSKNAYELQQLAMEHALAYFNKPWDYYLKEEAESKSKRISNFQEDNNFNSCVTCTKSSVIVEEKKGKFLTRSLFFMKCFVIIYICIPFY